MILFNKHKTLEKINKILHKDFRELCSLCFNGKHLPNHIRLFLTSEKKILYINNGGAQGPSTAFGIMASIRSDRGSILEAFANFEFLIMEFMRLEISGFENNKKLIDLIKSLSPKQRIQVLKNWKVIERDFANKLSGLFDLRNLAAHSIMDYEIEYNNKYIFDLKNFELFKIDMQESWNKLIGVYNEIVDHFDFTSLIQEIKDFQVAK